MFFKIHFLNVLFIFFFNKNVFINNNDLCCTATLKLLNLYKNMLILKHKVHKKWIKKVLKCIGTCKMSRSWIFICIKNPNMS